jgi:glycosyltransferase A (GT-A) superfamily protein (DUF2064 family)
VRAPVRVAVAILAPGAVAPSSSPRFSGLDDAADAALRRAMLLDTIDAALAPGWPLHLYVTPAADVEAMREALSADARLAAHPVEVHVHPQVDGDPGMRMGDAVARTLRAGHDVAVLVGADVPDLPPNALRAAAHAVGANPGQGPLAFGPTGDGGFYLVAAADAGALRAACAEPNGGGVRRLADLAARARTALGAVHFVTPWHAVDTRAALDALCQRARVSGRAQRTRQVADALTPGPAVE